MLIAFQITLLGMSLVFGAILLLWLMMTLLAKFTADETPASDSIKADPVSDTAILARAAAVAVAIALAEQGQSTAHALPQPPTAIVSAWQLGMRTRQMSEKGHR